MTEIRETLRFGSTDLEEMNRVMGRLQDRLDALEGLRGDPTFHQDVDFTDKRLLNVSGMAKTEASPTTFDQAVTFSLPINFPVIEKNAVPTTEDLPDNGSTALWHLTEAFGSYTVAPATYLVFNINGSIFRTGAFYNI